MPFQIKRVEYYLNTVWAIAASPYVSAYVIGYTSGTAHKRFSGYKHQGFNHIVTLANNLTQEDAKWLEEKLQDEIKSSDRRSTNYRKYHPDKRDLRYYPNVGRGTVDPTAPVHSVYMAWI